MYWETFSFCSARQIVKSQTMPFPCFSGIFIILCFNLSYQLAMSYFLSRLICSSACVLYCNSVEKLKHCRPYKDPYCIKGNSWQTYVEAFQTCILFSRKKINVAFLIISFGCHLKRVILSSFWHVYYPSIDGWRQVNYDNEPLSAKFTASIPTTMAFIIWAFMCGMVYCYQVIVQGGTG